MEQSPRETAGILPILAVHSLMSLMTGMPWHHIRQLLYSSLSFCRFIPETSSLDPRAAYIRISDGVTSSSLSQRVRTVIPSDSDAQQGPSASGTSQASYN